ncbi:MAG TPA: SPOR domain-containing protein [Luteimonas sp.]|nr:SPOR domain-containing protein [Luteimonas sp.]
MAARRGRSQARRNTGGGGLPGWAWLLLGAVLATVLVLWVPKLMDRGDGDGFFRPTPNPDAQPATSSADEVIAGDDAEPDDTPATATQYDFYKLLPADEVPMTDAELAATERAEAERRQRAADESAAARDRADAADELAHVAKVPAPTAGNDAPYLLQAGAFGASGDAEAVKARIALLGLTARVESATIEGKTVYRVRLGPYGTASELAEAKRKLAGAGLQTLAIKVK